jgi:predicted nucleic-acid-binding Zn-ribbon protein
MPWIFDLRCSTCGYKVNMTSDYTVVDMDSGREAICGHPREIDEAQRMTGLRWADLVRAKRIGYRRSLTCQSCGRSEYYRRDAQPPTLDDEAPAATIQARLDAGIPLDQLMDGIPDSPTPGLTIKHRCVHCDSASLVPSDTVGRGAEDVEVSCPMCRSPLERVLTAVS